MMKIRNLVLATVSDQPIGLLHIGVIHFIYFLRRTSGIMLSAERDSMNAVVRLLIIRQTVILHQSG